MKVKCVAIIVVLILGCVSNSYAGTHGGGLKGGMLISNPSGTDKDALNIEPIYTLTFGVFHRYTFTNLLSMQTEAFYAHKGSKGDYYFRDGEINIYYFDFDTVLQYRIYDNKNPYSYIFFGPVFSVRMGANIRFDEGQSIEIKDDIKPYDVGAVIGVKVGLTKGKNEFGLDVRYTAGFIAPDNSGREIDLKNRTIQIMFEMYFN